MKECHVLLNHVTKLRGHTLLFGPPGTGKTHYAVKSAVEGQEVFSMTAHEEMGNADIWGFLTPDGSGGTVWHPGPGMLAWLRGGILVINEADRMGESAMISTYSLLDDFEIARYTLTNGETIFPKEGFRAFLTTNENPDVFTEALRDRCKYTVKVDRPSEGALCALRSPVWQLAVANIYKAHAGREGATVSDMLFTYREAAAFLEARREGVPQIEASELVWGKRARSVLNHISALNIEETGPRG